MGQLIRMESRRYPKEVIESYWRKAKPFYEKHYRVFFRCRPKDRDIVFLYEQMMRLQDSLRAHENEARLYLQGLGASLGRVGKPKT